MCPMCRKDTVQDWVTVSGDRRGKWATAAADEAPDEPQ